MEKNDKLLESIIDNMNDAIMVFDLEGKLLLLNAEAKRTYSESALTTLSALHEQYLYTDLEGNQLTLEQHASTRAFRGEKVKNEKVVVKPKGKDKGKGKQQIIEMNASPIKDENGQITSIVMVYRDISEQMNNQRQLLEAEREKNEALENALKMKDDFLATITHEFRTPLTVINAALQSIDKLYGQELTEPVKKYLQRIKVNTFRQLRLVSNLLDITRYNAGHLKVNPEDLDIVLLTRSIVQSVDLYAKQKGVDLKFYSDTEHCETALDEEKYERILLNLLSNAIKFTPKDKRIAVILSIKDEKAYISVKDEGIGIPKSKQKKIFERFGQVDSLLTRQAEGSGIGLSLVKTLVKGMKGSISVESDYGKGSTFTVCLPIVKPKTSPPEATLFEGQDGRVIKAVAIEFSDIYLD